MILPKYVFLIIGSAVGLSAAAQSLSFAGNKLKVLEEIPEKSTGLEKIYILYDTEGVSVSYISPSGNHIKWQQYSNLGGGHAEDVGSTQIDNKSTLNSLEADKGYIVEDGDRRYCFWITDYSFHRLKLSSANGAMEQECGVSIIEVEGSGSPIRYFTINGIQKTINQEITVDYTTLEWNDKNENFEQINWQKSFESFQPEYRIIPPNYCASTFRVSGDKFLRAWNWDEYVETPIITPTSVDAHTFALRNDSGDSSTEEMTEESNQIGSNDTNAFGGSAPCSMTFTAYVTDGVAHNEWQLTKDPSFENIEYRFTTQDLDYTFLDEGIHYVRYIGSNADGSCEYIGDIYEINIGESQLLIPNAFSPNGDGVNDEWKVAYRSLLEFNCHIFDRNGHQVCHLTSPEQGWDGKIGGKTVDSGVFYYVIEAKGTDGKKIARSGDINVVKYVGGTSNGCVTQQ